jgi:hypothetical protein
MYSSAQVPTDATRTASYGAVGEIPNAMFQHFMSAFQADNAPNLHEVPAALLTLIETRKGARPQRVVVGASYGADEVNRLTQPVQRSVLEGLGLAHLDALVVHAGALDPELAEAEAGVAAFADTGLGHVSR